MAEPDLSQLRDIHLPPPIGHWPLAPGWYFLAVLVFGLLLIGLFRTWRIYHNGRAKREALQRLAQIRQQYQQDQNSQTCSANLSILLRQVALAYYPRAQVAGLHQAAWIDFLNQKNLFNQEAQKALLELPYQLPQQADLNPLLHATYLWIKHRGKPCFN